VIIVGGDGSIHEVLNGMLHREDKKRLPVAFIPNGTGNDMCYGINIKDVDVALSYIIKR
jgi:diacylglycerol kinase family enzyme